MRVVPLSVSTGSTSTATATEATSRTITGMSVRCGSAVVAIKMQNFLGIFSFIDHNLSLILHPRVYLMHK